MVDTPGTMDTSDPDTALHSLATALVLLDNKIDAFFIVLNYSTRMTAEETACFEKLKTLLGLLMLKYVFVVFTHGDNFEKMKKMDNYTYSIPVEANKT